ncbi:MAG: hypothetical protein NTW13_04980 [Candidatus Omnitrophica bacterium]|nr:hypothetical protein [Candidatus Omnitrophota bacterium]
MFRLMRKAQSTLEYVIILAAIIGAVVALSAGIKSRLGASYNSLGDKMQNKIETVNFGG